MVKQGAGEHGECGEGVGAGGIRGDVGYHLAVDVHGYLRRRAQFFTSIGNMGVEIFGLPWVGAVTRLFSLFGWGLFLAGLVVAVFDLAIAAQSGRVSVRDTALNTIRG